MFIIFSKSTVKLLVISINKFGDFVLHEIKIVVRMNSFSSLQYYFIRYISYFKVVLSEVVFICKVTKE